MKEQDFGSDKRPRAIVDDVRPWAIEQDFGYKDVRPSP